MKIDNSRIFVCDVHHITSIKKNVMFECDGVSFGNYETSSECHNHNVIVVEMKQGYYVPVAYLRNAVEYMAVKVGGYDEKFWLTTDKASPSLKFVANLQPVCEQSGNTDLKMLQKLQQRFNDITYEGGMEL